MGGAIVTWSGLGSEADIYAQRVDASGITVWMMDGVALCEASLVQSDPAIVPDGAGGAIVTWKDQRSPFGTQPDIYAQRVDASGTPLWIADGVGVCTAISGQGCPVIASDGAGGAIIAWQDPRNGIPLDVYAQRVDVSGTPLWTANGVAVCTAPYAQGCPAIISDGVGGAIIAWGDPRSDGWSHSDIYAQRIDPLGTPLWTIDGEVVGIRPFSWTVPGLVSDGAGGAIIAWQYSAVLSARRIDASGALPWPDAVALGTANDVLYRTMAIASDESGGAIVSWHSFGVSESRDIYAQRVDGSGALLWSDIALCTEALDQALPASVSDGEGGAIVAWQDSRQQATDVLDIYALSTKAMGWPTSVPTNLPEITAPLVLPHYPNPFTTTATLEIGLPAASSVEIEVFDVAGRRVSSRLMGFLSQGWHRVTLDGCDNAGKPLPSGVYLYRASAGEARVMRKMVIGR
jgi:hypothetical protein